MQKNQKKKRISSSRAREWIVERMMYGRYKPSKQNPFVWDECCEAGAIALEAIHLRDELPKYIDQLSNSNIGKRTALEKIKKYIMDYGKD